MFNANSYDINKQAWIMLSEVEFTAAVPEPSTWMMMVLGFAALGFAAIGATAGWLRRRHDLNSARRRKTTKATARWLLF